MKVKEFSGVLLCVSLLFGGGCVSLPTADIPNPGERVAHAECLQGSAVSPEQKAVIINSFGGITGTGMSWWTGPGPIFARGLICSGVRCGNGR